MLYKNKVYNPNRGYKAETTRATSSNKERVKSGKAFLFFLSEHLFFFFSYIVQQSAEDLIMRFCALAVCLVLAISIQDGWSLPLKSVFVTFPGDIIKNMTDTELAEVSSRWFILS